MSADDDKGWAATIKDAALGSAGSKGGEFAVKFVAGWIYNISCKPEQQTDEGSKALCSALGSVSGKSDEEWKKKIEGKLTEISGKLTALESGQAQILSSIKSQHQAMEAEFKQVGANVRITAILTTIDNFWGRFKAELDPKEKTPKVDLDNFAREVMNKNLQTELGELNSLLVNGINGGEPALRVPFDQFMKKVSKNGPPEAWDGFRTYDFAEKKLAYYRAEMQKAYLIYLWAAEIIEGNCEIKKEDPCTALTTTSKAFARDYERFTRMQVEKFDSFANEMILAYSLPESDDPNFLLNTPGIKKVLARINALTANLLGNGQGAWIEVIGTDGDPWGQKIDLLVTGRQIKLTPILSYTVPVDTRYGRTVDWWTSKNGNMTFDEVHFTSNWRIYHYSYEEAPVTNAIRIASAIPDTTYAKLPYTPERGVVENVTRDGVTYPFGVLYAFKRAGGTYALASGQDWVLPGEPTNEESGDAVRKGRFDWVISAGHHEGAWIDLLDEARVEQKAFATLTPTQEKKIKRWIYAYNKKNIYFPEGGPVRVRMKQHDWCEKVCRTGIDSDHQYNIMHYNIENSPYEDNKLTAVVSVFLDPTQGTDNWENRAKNGMYIDGSYGNTRERKEKQVRNDADGIATVNAGTAYHLQYLIYFDMLTHTQRADASSYFFLGKITPRWMFLTK